MTKRFNQLLDVGEIILAGVLLFVIVLWAFNYHDKVFNQALYDIQRQQMIESEYGK
jgi:hypothetical protein